MTQRCPLAALFVALICSISVVCHAAQPTAEELYTQGMQQYEAGNYTAALELFNRLDPVQLSAEQRVTMYEATQEADIRLRAPADPASILEQAGNERQPARAQALYRQVIANANATAEQKAVAEARLRELDRASQPQLTQMRRRLDDAAVDINAGRYGDAQRKLRSIQESGVDLGWFDNQRVERNLAVIEERMAMAAAPATTEAPVASAQADTPPAPRETTNQVVVTDSQTPQRIEYSEPFVTVTAPEPDAAVSAPPTQDSLAEHMKLYAQEQLALGHQAEGDGNYRLARSHYEKATQMDPSNAEAQAALDRMQAVACSCAAITAA